MRTPHLGSAPAAIAGVQTAVEPARNNARIDSWSDDELLRNAELTRDGRLTYAALLLFGTRDALTRHVPRAEAIFEYRSAEAAGPAQDRESEFRRDFFCIRTDSGTASISATTDRASRMACSESKYRRSMRRRFAKRC